MDFIITLFLLIIYTGSIVKYYEKEMDKLKDNIKLIKSRLDESNKKNEDLEYKTKFGDSYLYQTKFTDSNPMYPYANQPTQNYNNMSDDLPTDNPTNSLLHNNTTNV
tara:strand:- start:5359 stop:5679 length:321 start_codon:yes stop_codon:yes gene_type:complete